MTGDSAKLKKKLLEISFLRIRMVGSVSKDSMGGLALSLCCIFLELSVQ